MVKTFTEYLLTENKGAVDGVVNFIRLMAQTASGKQKEYYENMAKDIKPVQCVPLSDIFSQSEIREIRSVVAPKIKCCYENAYHFASRMQESLGREILYCEGYMLFHGLPIEHAFNKIDGRYVDITAELALKDDVTKNEYVLTGEWDENTALRAMAVDGCYGCVYQKLFMINHKDNIKQ